MTCSQPQCRSKAHFLVVTDGVIGSTSFLIAEVLCPPHQHSRGRSARAAKHRCRISVVPVNLLLFEPSYYVNGVAVDYETLGALSFTKIHSSKA